GSGRAALAREIHRRSARREGPFVLVRCGTGKQTLSQQLSDASPGDPGAMRRARQGTLHLGDIETMHAADQRSLLTIVRSLDHAAETAPRIVCSTRVSLDAEIARGRFDQELAQRLRAHAIEMPPLRSHLDDVP